MEQTGQAGITVTRKLFEDIKQNLKYTTFHTVAGFAEYVLLRELEKIKKEKNEG